MHEYERELELAKEAALSAGKLLKNMDERRISSSAGRDIKLEVDRLSEEVIIGSYLNEANSKYSILSEEMGLLIGEDQSHMWIVDPLDGSFNFARGMDDMCCISIALWKNEEKTSFPIFGVIYRFATDELYYGIVGVGAWKNNEPISTGKIDKLDEAVLSTGFSVNRNYSEDSLYSFIKNTQRFKKIRMLGAAAVMGSLVAEGKLDAYMEDNIMLWDIAASCAIVKAAGGIADIEILDDYKTICHLFGNEKLRDSYHAYCI